MTCGSGEPRLWLQKEDTVRSIDKFCSQFHGEEIKRGEDKSEKYFPSVGGVMSTMKIEWYDKSIGCGKGDFRDTDYTIDKVSLQCLAITPFSSTRG